MNKNDIYKNYKVEWYTPKSIIEYFGKFDCDPATTPEKAKEFGIDLFYTINTNGLENDWKGVVWLNPPFDKKKEFLLKMIEQFNKNKIEECFVLLPASINSKLWIEYIWKNEYFKGIYIPLKRICFETNGNIKFNRPPFDSVIIFFSNDLCIDKPFYNLMEVNI